jgi:hypothetical protein
MENGGRTPMMGGWSVESPGEWLMFTLAFVWPFVGPFVMVLLGVTSRSARPWARRTSLTISGTIAAFIAVVLLIARYPEPITTVAGDEVYDSQAITDLVASLIVCVGVITVLPWLVAYALAGRKRRGTRPS